MKNFDKYKNIFLKRIEKIKLTHLIIAFVILGLFAFLSDQNKSKTPPTKEISEDPTSVDTHIPIGMTLIPIEIINIESLKNIVGDFGIVDLYTQSFDEIKKPRKIASKVKIMRAPLNPDVFAVLVHDDKASLIAQHPGAFFVTVLNPKDNKTSFEENKKTLKTQIISEL